MLDWLNHIPAWVWIIVFFISICTAAIERKLQEIVNLLSELHEHFMPFDDDNPT
jgi:hypothetical protein